MKVIIDGKEVELDEPETILHAARRVGIDIPTMCYFDGYDPFTSCMICTVEDVGTGMKVPACTAQVRDGMEVATQSDAIKRFRQRTLDLLLSDHVGDCEAPCTRGCGVSMDIPQMIRDVMAKDPAAAIATVRKEMPLPAILERFCHGPCETPCRRGKYDEPIQIQQLSRYAADWDARQPEPVLPARAPASGKRVAIVGGGPTGLAAAHSIAVKGHDVVLFEREARVLDRFHDDTDPEQLPDWVLRGELRVLEAIGVELRVGVDPLAEAESEPAASLARLAADFDAVVLALGEQTDEFEFAAALGLKTTKKGLAVDPKKSSTNLDGVFAAGSFVKPDARILRSMTAGKNVSASVDQFLRGEPVTGPIDYYDHTMGKLSEDEVGSFASQASPIERRKPENLVREGFEPDIAELEATRCMHCDCREKNNCKLRIYSDEYEASQRHFKGDGPRATYEFINQDAGAVYEPGKCIKCGLCVHITQAEGEPFGFSFVGRGFDVKASVSLGRSLADGLTAVAAKVVEACPTGALAKNEKLEAQHPTKRDED